MLITNFASGELSKKLSGRSDLQQYYSGASYLKNFEIIPTGGIERRVGSKRMAKLHGLSRLIPFIINKDVNYILEFTTGKTYTYTKEESGETVTVTVTYGYVYVWKDGEAYNCAQNYSLNSLQDTDVTLETVNAGEQFRFLIPYSSIAQINEVQYAQDYDRLVFVQRDAAPYEFKYDISKRSFSAGLMVFNPYPNVKLDDDYSTDEKKIVVIADTTGLPTPDFIGQYCIYNGILYKADTLESWKAQEDEIEADLFNSDTNYPGCVAFYNSRLWFASTRAKGQKIWASAAPDTDGVRYNAFPTWQKYVTVNRVTKDLDAHIFTADITIANYDKENHTLTLINVSQDLTEKLAEDATEYYITGTYIPSGSNVLSVTASTIQVQVPTNFSLEEDLLSQTMTISLWVNASSASADDYEYEVINNNITTSDCSFNFEVASEQNDGIKFLNGNKYLVVGTESSTWCIPSSITALNVYAELNGRYGSDDIQGLLVDTATIYFAQGKKGIREYYYDVDKEAFTTNNIALQAEQMLTESEAYDFDFMTNPYNRLLVTRADGIVACLLYDKNNGVMGWNRIAHGYGKIINTAVTRGLEEYDLMYFEVKIGDDYYLELLDPSNKIFLDSYNLYSQTAAASYDEETAVVYNETQDSVTLLKDFAEESIKTGDIVYIGYKFESVISSMPVMTNDPTGKKRITALLVRFLESYRPELSIDNLPDEEFNDMEEPYSGLKKITYPGTSDRDVTFTIKTENVYPVNILSVNAATA